MLYTVLFPVWTSYYSPCIHVVCDGVKVLHLGQSTLEWNSVQNAIANAAASILCWQPCSIVNAILANSASVCNWTNIYLLHFLFLFGLLASLSMHVALPCKGAFPLRCKFAPHSAALKQTAWNRAEMCKTALVRSKKKSLLVDDQVWMANRNRYIDIYRSVDILPSTYSRE